MRTFVKVFLFVMILLVPSMGVSQAIPLDQKNWYSMSQVGVVPPVWPGIALSNWVRNTGLQIKEVPAAPTQLQTCFAASDRNCNAYVAGGPGAIFNVRIQDGDGTTLGDIVLMNGSALGITTYGLTTASGTYFWEPTGGAGGANPAAFTRWNGDDMGNATYTTPTAMYSPFNQVFLYGWDSVTGGGSGDRWRRIITDASGAIVTSGSGSTKIQDGDGADLADVAHMDGTAPAITLHALDVISGMNFWEPTGGAGGANPASFSRWNGDDMNNATYTTPLSLYSPFAQTFLYGWDSTNNDRWHRINVDSTGALVTAGSGSNSIKDGDSAVLADVIDTYTDNLAVGLNGLMGGSVMYLYDGATLDMGRAGAVGELQVTDVATRPGEDAANDWRKSKKQEIAVYSPAVETSGAIGAVAVVVLASKEVLSFPSYCVYVKNNDAADSLTDIDYQSSPDAASWVDLTEPAACDTLAPGVMCVFCESGNAYRYIRVQATGAAGPTITSVSTWLTANKG